MTDKKAPPSAPKLKKQLNLTGASIGRAKPKNSPKLDHKNADARSAEEMMQAMGFEPSETMTPLQFLIAIYNNQVESIYEDESIIRRTKISGGISVRYRIECAKTAARYLHMEAPKVSHLTHESSKYGKGLEDAILSGNERIKSKKLIIEEIERISPDTPLPDANYPPSFEKMKEVKEEAEPDKVRVDDGGFVMSLAPEGDTGYNPDEDD